MRTQFFWRGVNELFGKARSWEAVSKRELANAMSIRNRGRSRRYCLRDMAILWRRFFWLFNLGLMAAAMSHLECFSGF